MLSVLKRVTANFLERRCSSHLYAILAHPNEAKVLMLSNQAAWFLPHVVFDSDIYFDDFGEIKQAFEHKLGISVNVLYYAQKNYDKSKREIYSVYVPGRTHLVNKNA